MRGLAALFFILPAVAAVRVPLTIEEALYPGSMAGLNRNSAPVSAGIPLPDDADSGLTDAAQLTLSGAKAGQFRVLGRWPSGRIKWVLVDTLADVAAGQKNVSIALTNTGTGNFGGPDLAVDNGSTITVQTGTVRFTIRKANFNVIDEAVADGIPLVASGSSRGFVVAGPAPGQSTCPPCKTEYASVNDPASTAVIEENGPVKAVIRASGAHIDSAGNSYMHFTARLYFYKDSGTVKVTSVLRNADYGPSNSFETAYKGHSGYELRIAAAIGGGSARYAIGNHTASAVQGTLGATDSVYLYQAGSESMRWQDWCGFGCIPYTTRTGYSIVRNGTEVVSGSNTQYPAGWADVRDANGAGISVGVYQMAAYWPKSLEFLDGGSDVRIGIWPRQNDQPYYQPWPQWSIHDLYLNFHSAEMRSSQAEFLKFQHPLLARAPYTHYNLAGVFPYPLIDPAEEDAFYMATRNAASPATISAGAACCIQDFGTVSLNWPLNIYRFYAWNAGGGANQTEFRWSHLLNFLARGMTGRYLDTVHFYRFSAESVLPHSDGFNWRDKTGEYNGFGQPTAVSANSGLAFRNWRDQEHGHWYGMTDYYFMTGDETAREAILDQQKDWFLNPHTYQNGEGGGLYNTRAIGVQLLGAARFSKFLAATGDPDAEAVLEQGKNTYLKQVQPELCLSGYPEGCATGPVDGGPWTTQGVSRTRGVPWGAAGTSGTWCGQPHAYRVNSGFQPAILISGLLELREAAGKQWPEYMNSLDLAYGIARWNLSENYVDDGSGRWDVNGFRFGIALDTPNSCSGPGESPEPNFKPTAMQTVSMNFVVKHMVDGDTEWAQKFRINLQKDMAALGLTTSDFGSYQPAAVIHALANPAARLKDVAIDNIADNGDGSYAVSWTVPEGAQSYRIKWSPKRIVDWIGFDPVSNAFTGDPSTTTAWFAANNAENIPVPTEAGTAQKLTIKAGLSGLTAANFSVKAYVGGSENVIPAPPRVSMARSGGDGQTGKPGQTLAAPFSVKVTSPSGDPVPGAIVSFRVTAGGGSLSSTEVASGDDGIAAAVLTLGSAPGVNTVIAASDTLAGSPITFTATALEVPGGDAARSRVDWKRQGPTEGWPGYNGWHTLWFDPLSKQTILYGVVAGSSSIYSTDIFFYNPDTNKWTHPGGTGNKTNACPESTDSWPGDRHPVWQMSIDTRRNVLWLMGGVCQGNVRQDMYYLELNADPMQSKWRRIAPAHFPAANISAAMAYDPDNDVLFLFGSDGSANTRTNWLYCPTLGNDRPGTLSDAQNAAGCITPDDWIQVNPAGGVQPKAVAFPGMVYDAVTKKMVLFGGMNGGLTIPYNETWSYDVRTHSWTQKALSTTPPPVYSGSIVAQPAMAYNSHTHKLLYHQTSNTGSPADWEYDPAKDVWTQLQSTGGGATVDQYLSYDPHRNVLIGFNRSPATGEAEVWIGVLPE